MKTIKNILYIATFFIFLAYVAITIKNDDTKYLKYENRETVETPHISIESFFKDGMDDRLEASLKDRFKRDDLVYYEAFLDKYFYRRPFINKVHTRSPHFYDFTDHEKYKSEDKTEETLEILDGINKRLSENNTRFYVIPMPMISSVYNYPKGILNPESIDKKAQERLLEGLRKRGIKYIDPRKYLVLEDFYKTDHHVGVRGALKLIKVLEDRLKEDGLVLKHYEYSFKTHRFKGSRSKMMAYLTEDEDILEPIYNSSFVREGDGLKEINDFKNPSYVSFMGGDHRETRVINSDVEDGFAIIYGDSFTNVFESLLIPKLHKMTSYDLRFKRVDNPEERANVVILIAAENSFRLGEEYLNYFEDTGN